MSFEAAKRFLSEDGIQNSYPIARLRNLDNTVLLDDPDDPKAVLIKMDHTATMRGDKVALKELLGTLEKGEYRFHSVDHQSFQACEEVLDNIEDRPTWMMKRPWEENLEPEYEVVELEESDAEVIDQYWGLGRGDSIDYIKSRIREGQSYGIRQEGELVAWCLTHYITDKVVSLGFLHVKEGHRRKGYAKAVTEAMCSWAKEKNLIPVVDIFQDNEESLSLADKLGFQRIAENHWFSAEK
ncbi:MAG: GNAT family N-acetyltransferase [Thermoplasmata archaeon]